ncbi:hypothetical protein BKA56DRAFT_599446 [Ilyonectria sp. MPI-CAGE-AT-0026]|nr:hypothetical protein BKA56DRAFT_599446 [Ilyonectria sp. MPI-CAGE-AT-0026]
MPFNPELILGPLQAAKDLEEPLFPKRLQRDAVTPRKAKKDLHLIRDKLHILSSPTRAIISHAESALDLPIITMPSHQKILELQKERIRLEARRTHTRRQIRVDDGAYTVDQLRQKVNARSHEERAAAARKEGRLQAELFRDLREKEAAQGSSEAASRPRLRGRAAAIAKAAREADEEAQMQALREVQRLSYDNDAIEKLSQQWADADDQQRSHLYTTQPLSNLLAIPAVVSWKKEKEARSADQAESPETVINYDFISVASSIELPALPQEGESDSDGIEIITSVQIESTTRRIFNIQNRPFADEMAEESEAQLQTVDYGGFGYNRAPNRYSDDEVEPEIAIGGTQVTVPKSRRRT